VIGFALFAAALIGFAFVVRRPQWTAPYLALLLYLRFSDAIRAEYGLPSLFMMLMPALAALALWQWLSRGDRPGAGFMPAIWWMSAWGVVCAASLLYARDPGASVDALLNYADGVFIVALVTWFVRTREDLARSVWAVIIAGFVLAGLSVVQQLGGLATESFAGFAHVELRNIHSDTAGFRSEGPVSANYFALVLVAVVPLAVDRWLHARGRPARLFAAATCMLAVAGVYYTFSRGGLVALLITAMPMLAWVPRRTLVRAGAIAALPLFIALSYGATTEYGQRLLALGQLVGAKSTAAPTDSALTGRISEVTSAAMMFGDHPILGVGVGNYEEHYHRYAQQVGLDGRREERQAHSLYLEVAAESGVVGLLVFGSMLFYAAVGPWRARQGCLDRGDVETARLLAAVGLAFFGYLVGSLFLHLSYPRYFWLMYGLVLSTRQWLPAAGTARVERRPRLAAHAVGESA
jgi:O-antigen ligase